jgi:hypothetical protein
MEIDIFWSIRKGQNSILHRFSGFFQGWGLGKSSEVSRKWREDLVE